MNDDKNNNNNKAIKIQKVTPNRLKHSDFPSPYTRILNSTIDIIPDDGALGMYVYLARKPTDWDIQEADLMRRFSRGRDHVRKCLAILKEVGLMKKNAIRNEKGHVIAWETILYCQVPEIPSSGVELQPAPDKASIQITEIPESGAIQITEIPTSGKIHLLDNPTHTNKRYIQTKEKELQTKDICAFEMFWDEYPRKLGKKLAKQKWISLKLDEHIEEILEKVKLQKENDWRGKELQYIPYAQTYLNQARWQDEVELSRENQEAVKKAEAKKKADEAAAERFRLQEEAARMAHQSRTSQERKPTPNKPYVSIMEMVRNYKPENK